MPVSRLELVARRIDDRSSLRLGLPRRRSGDPAEPFDLGVDDSYTTVPGIQQSLGAVYDQDTGNLATLTRGMRASMTGRQNLGRHQESRTRHMHRTLAHHLAEETPS